MEGIHALALEPTDVELVHHILGLYPCNGDTLDRVARIRRDLKPLLPTAPAPEAPPPQA